MESTTERHWLEGLHPGYFTLTMATGIIAIGMDLMEMPLLSDIMCIAALFSWWLIFWLFIWRLLRYPKAVWADLTSPRVTFNYFTFVAATCVSGLVLHMHGYEYFALLCWAVAFVAWGLLLYFSFGVLTLTHGERTLKIVDGGWLICIVGTESLVILGLQVIGQVGALDVFMMLTLYMLWMLGLILYGIFVTLFCYRIFFMEMEFDDYTPQMWVIMGAAAISANASSGLELSYPVIHILAEVHSFVESIALLTWAWATWWLPLLIIISFWKHVVHKIPLRYDPKQWSIVFPLGMYTVASVQLSVATEFDPLHWISHIMVWVAFAVWGIFMLALLRRVGMRVFGRARA